MEEQPPPPPQVETQLQRLRMRSWPFWPNKRDALEMRWVESIHPPASRWIRLLLLPVAGVCGLPFIYEWLHHLQKPRPTFNDLKKIADGPLVKNWWKDTVAGGVLDDIVAPEFLAGDLSVPLSVDRVHEVSYFYERLPSQRPDATGEWAEGITTWRDQRIFLTVVSDITPPRVKVVDPPKSAEEEDTDDYESMVRLTRDPFWYSAAMHDPGSPRLFGEWLDQRIELRKNLMNQHAHKWSVLNDTPYDMAWQIELADVLLLPPSRLWLPAKRVNAVLPNEALRLTTTFEIRPKDAEPQFVAASLCPRLVRSKEEDVCLTINGRPERQRSFLWWQNWETRNGAGRECTGTILRHEYDGMRGVRDGRALRGSRWPRLTVGVRSWEPRAVPVYDDAVHHIAGPDAWFLRNSGKMQETWIYEHDAFDEDEAFLPEQYAREEGQPFTGDYHNPSMKGFHTVPPPHEGRLPSDEYEEAWGPEDDDLNSFQGEHDGSSWGIGGTQEVRGGHIVR